eukprot:GHVR01122085.1.p2 GENE.GHVR01122085.1~~GHVR01122085.1.p2  ORF type:complete len:123 (-),score=58.26 GHVR01122085.1:58-426(-)
MEQQVISIMGIHTHTHTHTHTHKQGEHPSPSSRAAPSKIGICGTPTHTHDDMGQGADSSHGSVSTSALNTRPSTSKCENCGRSLLNPKRCGRCQVVVYCNKTCQSIHWKTHKLTCNTQRMKK